MVSYIVSGHNMVLNTVSECINLKNGGKIVEEIQWVIMKNYMKKLRTIPKM